MVWDINVKKDRRSSAGKYVWGYARVHRSTDLELYGEGVDLNIGFLNIWCPINILPIIFHAWHSRKPFSLAFSTSRNKLRLNIAYLHRNTDRPFKKVQKPNQRKQTRWSAFLIESKLLPSSNFRWTGRRAANVRAKPFPAQFLQKTFSSSLLSSTRVQDEVELSIRVRFGLEAVLMMFNIENIKANT